MNKLTKIVTIINNDEDTVILKIDENKKLELLSIGCFNGNEDMLILSKLSSKNTDMLGYNIIYKDGTNTSFSGSGCLSEKLAAITRWMKETVVFDFGIPIEGYQNTEPLKKFSYIKTIEDDLNTPHTFELTGFNHNDMCLRKDGAFMHRGENKEFYMNYLSERYNIVSNERRISSNTGCVIYTIKTEKK